METLEYRTTPKSNWELFTWLILDPDKVRQYEESRNEISNKRELIFNHFFTIYLYISILTFLIWLLALWIIAYFDLSHHYALFIETDWNSTPRSPLSLIMNQFPSLVEGLGIGLGSGLIGGLAGGISVGLGGGLIGGLVSGLGFGLVGCLGGNLIGGFDFGLIIGLITGLGCGLVGNMEAFWGVGLVGCLGIGVVRSLGSFGISCTAYLIGSIGVGLGFGLGFEFTFFIMMFRVPFYVLYWLEGIWNKTEFTRNAYIKDASIWLRLPLQEKKLVDAMDEKPETGLMFIIFLFEYRKKQKNLKYLLLHAYQATIWKINKFNPQYFQWINMEGPKKYRSSESWKQLHQVSLAQLENYHTEPTENFINKLELFKGYAHAMEKLIAQAKLENRAWTQYYDKCFESLQREIPKQIKELEQQARNQKGLTNPYARGNALNTEKYEKVFMGRTELSNELRTKLAYATELLTFYVQGERRMGKSSFTEFLQKFLGEGNLLVRISFQTSEDPVENFRLMQKTAYYKLFHGRLFKEPEPETDWVKAWVQCFNNIERWANDCGKKLILALDEFEYLHLALQRSPEKGEALLASFRACSDRNSPITLVFVSAYFATELQKPDVNQFLVHAVPMHIGYLNEADSLKLMQVAGLTYDEGLLDTFWADTQGHPALTQIICYHLVEYANNITQDTHITCDIYLETVNKNIVEAPENGVVDIFWTEFCGMKHNIQPEVGEMVRTGKIGNRKVYLILNDHHYIKEYEAERYRFRVPLFERWLKYRGHV